MIVVAFDTATEAVALGVAEWRPDGRGEVLATRDLIAPRAANTRLLPELQSLLDELGLRPASIGAVVVGRGPGSFTGVRIGVATAKGLAHGLSVPLFGVGTLAAVARRSSDRGGLIGVVGDAMRSEIYPALFRAEGGRLERLTDDEVAGPAEVAHRWAAEVDGPLILTGNGLAKHEADFRNALGERAEITEADTWTPTGEALLREAFDACDFTTRPHAGVMLPVYTRLSDAEEAERRKLAADPGCAVRGATGSVPDTGVAGPERGAP